MGQVAMATDHGGRRTMPTGDAGSPISGQSSETREEAMTGAWTVQPVARGAVGGQTEATKRENGVCDFTGRLQLKVIRKVLRAVALRTA